MNRQYVDISHFRAPYKNWPYIGIGEVPAQYTQSSIQVKPANTGLSKITSNPIYRLAQSASSLISAYHGYKRNGDSWGWGFAWMIFGGIVPGVGPAIAFSQGYAKPAYKTVAVANKRSSRGKKSRHGKKRG